MTADKHALLGPFVVNALGPIERIRFEAHLETCALCQSELPAMRESAGRLDDV